MESVTSWSVTFLFRKCGEGEISCFGESWSRQTDSTYVRNAVCVCVCACVCVCVCMCVCLCHLETRFLTHARRRSLPSLTLPPCWYESDEWREVVLWWRLYTVPSIKEGLLVAWCRVAAWVKCVYVMEWVAHNGGLSKSTGSHRPSGTWRRIVWHMPYISDEPLSS
jgi:hypothetical protein